MKLMIFIFWFTNFCSAFAGVQPLGDEEVDKYIDKHTCEYGIEEHKYNLWSVERALNNMLNSKNNSDDDTSMLWAKEMSLSAWDRSTGIVHKLFRLISVNNYILTLNIRHLEGELLKFTCSATEAGKNRLTVSCNSIDSLPGFVMRVDSSCFQTDQGEEVGEV